mgnify:CR=1 FL=1
MPLDLGVPFGGFTETLEQADESTRLATNWVRDEKLETALPNPPKVTGGEVIVKKMGFDDLNVFIQEKVGRRIVVFGATGGAGGIARAGQGGRAGRMWFSHRGWWSRPAGTVGCRS